RHGDLPLQRRRRVADLSRFLPGLRVRAEPVPGNAGRLALATCEARGDGPEARPAVPGDVADRLRHRQRSDVEIHHAGARIFLGRDRPFTRPRVVFQLGASAVEIVTLTRRVDRRADMQIRDDVLETTTATLALTGQLVGDAIERISTDEWLERPGPRSNHVLW